MTDETTDIAEKSQVVVTYRYVRGSKPVERFWSFFNPDDLTSETLSNLLQNQLHPLMSKILRNLLPKLLSLKVQSYHLSFNIFSI